MGIPSLITSTNFNSIGNDINIVGTFASVDSISSSDKYVSPMLLNYVEEYEYKGVKKTLFYTEVNTNLKEGDRVFIINGNYDSNELIKSDKYKKGRDGYKVLFVDYCKIALDIDYTGDLPNIGNVESGDNISDYIKIYYIDSYDSFLLANKQISTRNGTFNYKFDYYQNNIAFIDKDYSSIDNGWVYNTGITASPGFYVKSPTQSSWTSITNEFINSGSYSLALASSFNFYNNGKLKVMSKSFTYNGFEFQNGYVYVWDSQNLTWKIDIKEQSTFTKAIISKSNFIDGDFKGSFNSGVYGSKSKKITWTGDGMWNGGTLLNTSWKTGPMNSKIILPISYQASIRMSSNTMTPHQKINTYNNGGYGFNYIIESEFESSSIYSAIIRNAKFGGSPTLPVIENHIMSYTQSFDNVITNGLFESSEFSNVSLVGGVIKNTRSRNSKFTDVKIINSFIKKSVITNSTIISDSVIKIDGYDELNSSERRSLISKTLSKSIDFKVYRFYIGEADFFKLRNGDSFYIKGVKIKNDKNVINFFDKKFTIGNWTEYIDDYNKSSDLPILPSETFYKRGVEFAAFLCTPDENEWIYNSTATQSGVSNYYTEAIVENLNPRYSIDIFVSIKDINNVIVEGLNFDYATQSSLSATLNRPKYLGNIDVSDAYIIDSDIDSSYIENSQWNSGYNINYNNDLVISSFTNSTTITDYNISINNSNQLVVKTPFNYLKPEIVDTNSYTLSSDIKSGDILFLDSVDYYTKGKVISFEITASGSNYLDNDFIYASYSTSTSYSGYGLVLSNINSSLTNIGTLSIINTGLDYSVGDTLVLSYPGQGSDAGGTDAEITITSVDTNVVRLNDSYKVVSNLAGTFTLEELVTGTNSIVAGLTANGVFRTNNADNRWNYLSRTKITNSKLKSGFFRRSHITNSLIQDLDYDVTDKDYNNISKIKNLVISDILFSNNGNNLSYATYLNSSFVNGNDVWDNGIIQNSILNGITFNRGIIKESTWLDGTFNGGTFYNSRSYNDDNTGNNFIENTTKSYYRGGITNEFINNDRYSWQNGTFNGGDFYKSNWEDGSFNNGLFLNSKFYGGNIYGGIIGDDSTQDTYIYNGNIYYTIVNNANIYAKSGKVIQWNDGIFNKGIFSADKYSYAIWENGIFNGGQFTNNARWNNGTFNGGKFISTYAWNIDTKPFLTTSGTYYWNNGTFNGGDFGNGATGPNSTWGNGDFQGGIFKGRLWANGVFKSGEFYGSGKTATGFNVLVGTPSNTQKFVDDFNSTAFYGLWLDGLVTNQKDVYVTDKKFYTDPTRSNETIANNLTTKFKDILWKSGEFNHADGTILNSVWLDGSFKSGNFIQSSFNPYINGNFNTKDLTCYWDNGILTDSEFFYSNWNNGNFISGTAVGMIFNNGTSYYMNAYNILWNNGIWKNGNWNGSIFEYNGSITNQYVIKVIDRVNSIKGTQSLHIWNIFEDIKNSNKLITEDSTNKNINTSQPGLNTPEFNNSNSFFPPIVL